MFPMTHWIQSSPQMRQHYRLYHTTGDQGNPSMVIQLPFLGVNPQTWSFYHGDSRGVTSSTRRIDLTVVPLHASNSWTYMMLFLSQSLGHSMTETTFTELSRINGRIFSSIMTPTQCWSLKWQSRQNAKQLKTMHPLLKMDPTLHPSILHFAPQRRLFVFMKRRWYHSTMLVSMYYFIPSAFTKGSTITRVARYLYRLNCFAGIVFKLPVEWQHATRRIKTKLLKDRCAFQV